MQRCAENLLLQQRALASPVLFLTLNQSPLQLKSINSAETEIQARKFSHIPELRTNTRGAQAEASPASADPAFQNSNVLSVCISASQPRSLGLCSMNFSLKRIAASLTCLCGMKKHDA